MFTLFAAFSTPKQVPSSIEESITLNKKMITCFVSWNIEKASKTNIVYHSF